MLEVQRDAFVRSPVGRWTIAGTSAVWCDSATLWGSMCWGAPTVADVDAVVGVFEAMSASLAPKFDVVLDARLLETVAADAFAAFVSWVRAQLDRLRQRVRLQVGIIAEGPLGYMLSGLLPVAGDAHAFRVFTDAAKAFELVAPGRGSALLFEIERMADGASGVAREVRALRDLLRQHGGNLSVERAARELRTSVRSLQRALRDRGSSFRKEQLDLRFSAACSLLSNSDEKVSQVAARVGVTERALSLLFHARAGMTPAEYRLRGTQRA